MTAGSPAMRTGRGRDTGVAPGEHGERAVTPGLLVPDWVPGLLASVLTHLLLSNARPMTDDVQRRFTAPG